MDMWKVLGIEKTRDMDIIRDAYRKKLMVTHPEDDPEGFKVLREAYEAAVRYSKEVEDEHESEDYPDTPAGGWIRRVEEVYRDFKSRIDEECWDELLLDDVCTGIDSCEEALEMLMVFFTKNNLLPTNIWKKLVDFFEIEERKQELLEKYPEDFISYIINCARFPGRFDFYLFDRNESGLPYDEFIEGYVELVTAIDDGELETAGNALERLEGMPMSHPYVMIQKTRLLMKQGQEKEAEEVLDLLLEEYPDLGVAKQLAAEIYESLGRYDASMKAYEDILSIAPDNYIAKRGVADCLLAMNNPKDAKKIYKDLLLIDRFDGYSNTKIMDCNEILIPYYEEKLNENPEDDESRIELIWCLYQNMRNSEALELVDNSDRDDIYGLDYMYLNARCFLQDGNMEKAEAFFLKFLSKLPDFLSEEGEPGQRNRDREGLVYFFLAEISYSKKKYEEALQYNSEALKTSVIDRGMILSQRSRTLNKLGVYDEAEDAARKSLELEPGNFDSYICLGEIYENQRYLRDAVDCYEKAIQIYPYYGKPYIDIVRIYINVGMYSEAGETLKRLEKYQPDSDQVLLYSAKLARETEKLLEAKKFLDVLEERFRDDEHESDLDGEDTFWHEKALVTYYIDSPDRLEKTMECIRRAVEENGEEPRYQYFCGNVLWEMGELTEALENYYKCLELGPENPNVYFQMAGVYHDLKDENMEEGMLLNVLRLYPEHEQAHGRLAQVYENRNEYDEAIEEYTLQLQISPSGYYYVSRGNLLFSQGKYDESIKDYETALSLKDNDAYANYNMGRVYMALGKLEEARLLFEEAIEISEEPVYTFRKYLAQVYCRMGQCDKAIEIFKDMIKSGINPVGSTYYLGRALKMAGRMEEALAVYRDGADFKGSSSRLFVSEVSVMYIDVFREPEKAENYLETLKNKRINYEELLDDFAYLYRETGQIYKEYAVRKKDDKNYAADWYNFALSVKKMLERPGIKQEDREQYQSEYREAVEKTRNTAETGMREYSDRAYNLKVLAGLYIDEGDLELAKKLLEELSHTQMCDHCFERKCYEYYYQLARYYVKTGEIKLAREAIGTACSIAPDDKQCYDLAKEIEDDYRD